MENVILNPKEFLFLCSEMGATEVYGIIDGYKDVDMNDPSTEISLVQQSLEKKGYIESDFDGNMSINSLVASYVAVCAGCQKMIAFDSLNKDKGTTNIVYYFDDDKIVRSARNDGDYSLSYVTIEKIRHEIKKGVILEKIGSTQKFDKAQISQIELDKIKKMFLSKEKEAATNELCKHVNAALADVLLRSFAQKENFYSVTTVDFTAEEEAVKSLMVISSSNTNIKMTPVVVDLRTMVEFEEIDGDTILSIIEDYLKVIDSKQTGDETDG